MAFFDYVRGAVDLWIIRHFWRPLLVAISADLIATSLGGDNGTINVITFACAFAISEPIFLLLARRRRARGRLSLPEHVVHWYDARVEEGADVEEGVDVWTGKLRRASALMVAGGVITLAMAGVFTAILLSPSSFGEQRYTVPGRLAVAAVSGLEIPAGLVLLVAGVAFFLSPRVSREFARERERRVGPFNEASLVSNLSLLVPTAILVPALFFAAPAPTAAQRAADRARAAARSAAATQARAAAARTRNVHRIGTSAADGDLVFSVREIRRVASIPQEGSSPFRPVVGDKLLAVTIGVHNSGRRTFYPFPLPGYGALLVDARGRRFRFVDANLTIKPEAWPHGVARDATSSQTLFFQLPAASHINGVLVWNPLEPHDRAGSSYVYFRAGRAPAPPKLGPTAYAPSADR